MDIKAYFPQKLKGLVQMIWEQKATDGGTWKILPSGYVELIFMVGPSIDQVSGRLIKDGFNPTQLFCFLSGLHTKPLNMEYSIFHTMGIQMHPIAVKAIFGIPCSKVRDWAIEGELLPVHLAEVEDHLREPGDFYAKAAWLESWLLKNMKDSGGVQTAFKLKQVLEQAKRNMKNGQREKLEDLVGYSRMHTYELFQDWLGLSPGRALRLSQYTDTFKWLQDPQVSLTEAGLQNGFYDQAHFIRVFREFSDMTPGEYRKRMTDIPGQLPY